MNNVTIIVATVVVMVCALAVPAHAGGGDIPEEEINLGDLSCPAPTACELGNAPEKHVCQLECDACERIKQLENDLEGLRTNGGSDDAIKALETRATRLRVRVRRLETFRKRVESWNVPKIRERVEKAHTRIDRLDGLLKALGEQGRVDPQTVRRIQRGIDQLRERQARDRAQLQRRIDALRDMFPDDWKRIFASFVEIKGNIQTLDDRIDDLDDRLDALEQNRFRAELGFRFCSQKRLTLRQTVVRDNKCLGVVGAMSFVLDAPTVSWFEAFHFRFGGGIDFTRGQAPNREVELVLGVDALFPVDGRFSAGPTVTYSPRASVNGTWDKNLLSHRLTPGMVLTYDVARFGAGNALSIDFRYGPSLETSVFRKEDRIEKTAFDWTGSTGSLGFSLSF